MKDTCSRKNDSGFVKKLKREAKLLLKAYRNGDSEAISRVRKVWVTPNAVLLMALKEQEDKYVGNAM